MGKHFQACTATNLDRRLMHQAPPPCSLASHIEECSTGSWKPSFGGLCTPGSAVHQPSLQICIYLSAEVCSALADPSLALSVGPLVYIYLLQSGCCRMGTETSRFPGRSTGQQCRHSSGHPPFPAGDSCRAEQDQCLPILIRYSENYLNYPH